ncbi:MAG TPA: hypothetical protein VEY10_09000 [Flavisolibacter sp.]|nr:hypothetical protein [Flavisolibacter sp.]
MRNLSQESTSSAPLIVEEYIEPELKSGRRHEFINDQVIERPGEKFITRLPD